MVEINPINLNKQNIESNSLVTNNNGSEGSIWAIFSDSNGIVDVNDVKYSSSDVVCAKIQKFLNKHIGEEYTSKISNKISKLIQKFNDSNNVRIEQEYNEEDDENTIIIFDKQTDTPKTKIVKDKYGTEYRYTGINLNWLEGFCTYWENGNIKETYERFNYSVRKMTYRKDGTIYSEEVRSIGLVESKDFMKFDRAGIRSKIKYKQDGVTPKSKLIYDSETDEYTLNRYVNGRLGAIEHFDSSMKRTNSFIIDSKKYGDLSIEYDNGKIVCYEKHLPEGIEDFNESALNGEYDVPPQQGITGTCYIAAPVISFMQTPTGLSIINQSVDYDEALDRGKSIFQGLGKEYCFSKQEIAEAMSRLGREEPDYVLSVLGYEKLKEENDKYVDDGRLDEFINAVLPPGKECYVADSFVLPEAIDGLRRDMKKYDFVIIAGTKEETVDNEWSDEKNVEKHFLPTHAYAVKDITETSVIVIEPNTNTENEYTLEEFYEKFDQIAFARLN